jgi:glycosyltransferase involved in cell wall biosynthesis
VAGRVVMIGSARDVRGGVSALVNVYFAEGLFERWDARYVATHCDGPALRKLARAARAWWQVVPAMALGRVSLLHAHIATGASFWRKAAFVLPARLFGVPYILHMHGGDLEDYVARQGALARRLLDSVYSRAAAVIALSPQWQATLERLFPRARVVSIANPVQIPAAVATLDDDPPTVAFLGVIEERKGVHDLLHAWARVVCEVPDARLVIAGSGDWNAAASLARSLGIEACVEAPGWIDAQEKARLLQRSWAFVLPSHFEALPMSLLEAMAAGVPPVATRVGAIPEALDGGAGILVEPHDPQGLATALLALLGDRGRRQAVGISARRRAESRYGAGRCIEAVEALWRGGSPEGLRGTILGRHA